MTLEQYKSFSETEKNQLHFAYSIHVWTFKYPVPDNLLDFNYYEQARRIQRAKSSGITWPEHLSKKEIVLCKIAMLRRALSFVVHDKVNHADAAIMHLAVVTFLKDVEREIFAFKSSAESKWPGLDPDVAKVLNALYKSLEKSLTTPTAAQQTIEDYLQNGGTGDLRLCKTAISTLPDKLKKVRGSLYLNECKLLKSLPDNLQVKGHLFLATCNALKYLPNKLQVGCDLHLKNTSIAEKHSKEEIKKMIVDAGGHVKGNIWI